MRATILPQANFNKYNNRYSEWTSILTQIMPSKLNNNWIFLTFTSTYIFSLRTRTNAPYYWGAEEESKYPDLTFFPLRLVLPSAKSSCKPKCKVTCWCSTHIRLPWEKEGWRGWGVDGCWGWAEMDKREFVSYLAPDLMWKGLKAKPLKRLYTCSSTCQAQSLIFHVIAQMPLRQWGLLSLPWVEQQCVFLLPLTVSVPLCCFEFDSSTISTGQTMHFASCSVSLSSLDHQCEENRKYFLSFESPPCPQCLHQQQLASHRRSTHICWWRKDRVNKLWGKNPTSCFKTL